MKKRTWLIILIFELAAIFGYTYACYAREVVYTNGVNHKHDFFKCTEEADTQKVEEHMKNRIAFAVVVDLSNLNEQLQFLTKKNSVIYRSSDNGETINFVLVYNKDTNEFVRY